MIAKKLAMCAAGLVIGAMCAVGTPAPAHATTIGNDMIALVNQYRVSLGLHPVKKDPSIQGEATEWANTMAHGDRYEHSSKNLYEIIFNPGLDVPDSDLAPYSVNAWRNSPSHNRIMLEENITRVGADCAKGKKANYCIMNFM